MELLRDNFRKLIILGVFIIIVTALTGCSKESPEDVAKSFLDRLKRSNSYEFSILISGEALEEPSEEEKDEMDTMDKSKQFSMLKEFNYEILNVQFDKDAESAYVDVLITTYNFADIYKSYSQEASVNSKQWNDEGLSQEEIQLSMDALFDSYLEKGEKNYQDTVTLVLVKNDDTWEVYPPGNDEQFLDTIYGGLISFVDYAEEE